MKSLPTLLALALGASLSAAPLTKIPARGPLPRVQPPQKPVSEGSALDQRMDFVAKIAAEMDATPGPAEQISLLRKHFRNALSARFRLMMLDLLVKRPGPESDRFLSEVLESDINAAVRQRAATMLGFQGGPETAAALEEASLSDPVTRHIGGCKNVDQSARPAASKALAMLRRRFPQLHEGAEPGAEPAAVDAQETTGEAPRPAPSNQSWIR